MWQIWTCEDAESRREVGAVKDCFPTSFSVATESLGILDDLPGGLLAIRPGDSIDDIIKKVGAGYISQDDSESGVKSLPYPSIFRRHGDGNIFEVVYYSLPREVLFGNVYIGMPGEDAKVARPDLGEFWHDRLYKELSYLESTEFDQYAMRICIKDAMVLSISFIDRDIVADERFLRNARKENLKKAVINQAVINNGDLSFEKCETLLDQWSKSTSYWGIKDGRFAWIANWLRSASPSQWHSMATQWNWDYGMEPLVWIARQPNCAKATALDIYWKIQPDFYAASDFLPAELGAWDELACATAVHIARRWREGFYQQSDIEWKAPDYLSHSDMEKLKADASMRKSLSGRSVGAELFRSMIPKGYCFD